MKNVLVTGVSGMLGSNIAYLLRDKYNIIGIDTNHFSMMGVKFFNSSAIDVEKVTEIMEKCEVDAVVHCAALVNVDACEENPGYANAVNFSMAKNLNYLCKVYHAQFIFISTDAVYSGNKEGLNTEMDEPAPVSVYGQTKLKAENAVLQNENALVLRTNMYGFNYRDKTSFGEWVVQELRKEKTLNMFYDVQFSPLLVNELVDIIGLCIERKLSGLYNVGCRTPISKYDLGCMLQNEFGLPGTIRKASMHDFNFTAPRTENMGLDCTKLQHELGITLPSPIDDVRKFKQLFDEGYSKHLKRGE